MDDLVDPVERPVQTRRIAEIPLDLVDRWNRGLSGTDRDAIQGTDTAPVRQEPPDDMATDEATPSGY